MSATIITATNPIDNFEDIIDSRDIIARIEELEEVLEEYEELPTDLMDELIALRNLAIDGEEYSEEWSDGATLIRETYFTEYAQELCEELYEFPDTNGGWSPFNYIYWEGVARDMKMDYTSVTFTLDGHAMEYWIR